LLWALLLQQLPTAVVYRVVTQQRLVVYLLAQWSFLSTGCIYHNTETSEYKARSLDAI
jgi:hypothetical protein